MFEPIEDAVIMTEQGLGRFLPNSHSQILRQQTRRFSWATFLPKRSAWLQTLVLFPFGLPVANFLGAGWNLAVNLIVEEHQYLIGVLSIAFNLFLSILFFACLFQWCWFAWTKEGQTWYPKLEGFWAGFYATLTISISFGVVRLFTQNLGVCGSSGWGEIGQSLLCNLDNYGFESKSWFGAWFIIAAYCYQAQGKIQTNFDRIFRRDSHPQHHLGFSTDLDLPGDEQDSAGETIPPSGES
jgi:hypothetical protein